MTNLHTKTMSLMKTPINWQFNIDAEPADKQDDDWYCLCNGYIDPAYLLADPAQVRTVWKATEVLQSFFLALRKSGLREDY